MVRKEAVIIARRGENIYKRKDGRYEGRYIKEYNSAGKAVYGYVYSKSYSDIKSRLNNMKYSQSQINHEDITIAQALNMWINEKNDIKETTRQIYIGHIKNHILPQIGSLKLHNITAETIQSFINSLSLAPSTTGVIFNCLKAAISEYADNNGIYINFSKIKLPHKVKSASSALTREQQSKLESVLTREDDIGILICLYTGLRIGELCALKWEDIDFENSIIYVKRTQARVNGKIEFISPKSQSSLRGIPTPGFIMKRLKNCSRKGEFVLSHNSGYYDVRSYRRHFKRLLIKADLPDIRFHTLRHTFATRALEVGMDFKTLSEILGHSSTSITLDLYVHSLYEHKKNQMNKLAKIYNSQS